MKNLNQLQSDYSRNGRYIQLALPINTEYFIPVDDSVRLIDQVLEEIDYRELYLTSLMKEYVITRKLSTLFGVLAEYFSAFWQKLSNLSAAFNIIFTDIYLLP